MYIYQSICVYIYIHMYVYINICVCMYVCMFEYIHNYVYMYIYIPIHIHIRIHKYQYIHTLSDGLSIQALIRVSTKYSSKFITLLTESIIVLNINKFRLSHRVLNTNIPSNTGLTIMSIEYRMESFSQNHEN
jgi:hypothetical protein